MGGSLSFEEGVFDEFDRLGRRELWIYFEYQIWIKWVSGDFLLCCTDRNDYSFDIDQSTSWCLTYSYDRKILITDRHLVSESLARCTLQIVADKVFADYCYVSMETKVLW
jgi:hypothetical protein